MAKNIKTKWNTIVPVGAGLGGEASANIKSRLKAAKQYLKSDFKIHISKETPCADHCSVYALSSGEADHRGTCQHQHSICYDRCDDLRNTIVNIQLALSSSEVHFSDEDRREEINHDLESALPKLEDWKAHIVRAVHQDAAKSAVIDTMSDMEAVTINTRRKIRREL
ncbi:hypothetical protein QZH41_002327 [Actinostola sp. cb2023]|nr:hypothetical protein QZH41_002327 [Actinostola sp. cb2023]